MGYFEGWARDRPCENFWPEQIPTGLYTHINFAFGRINPDTFVIEASDPRDKLMYERLMSLKKRDKDLKIFLAIGGWTFNDPGPTANVFSDLAASKPRQRDFFKSVQSFMSHYGFDGLDLDWEYPVDKDRGGRKDDYESFPTFMAELKRGLDTGGKGLTITLPESYWYLQYFDIKKLVSLIASAEKLWSNPETRNPRLTSSTLCPMICTAHGTNMPTGRSHTSMPIPTLPRLSQHLTFFGATTLIQVRSLWDLDSMGEPSLPLHQHAKSPVVFSAKRPSRVRAVWKEWCSCICFCKPFWKLVGFHNSQFHIF